MNTLLPLLIGTTLTVAAAEFELLTTGGMNLARSSSHDGRFLAITTWSPLAAEDTNELADLYILNRPFQSTFLASLGTNGFTGYGSVNFGLISSNGSNVVYEFGSAVYRRQTADPFPEILVPVAAATRRLQNVSRDGRFTFYSTDSSPAYFRRDNDAGTNLSLSTIAGSLISDDGQRAVYGVSSTRAVIANLETGLTNNVAVAPIALSANGQVIVSSTIALNLAIQDMLAGSSNSFPIPTTTASISADGQIIAYEARGFLGKLPYAQVALVNPTSGTTNLISARAGSSENGNGWSGAPVISRDGRFIAFESWATDLVPNDTNQTKDVYLYDRLTATLKQINAGGGPSFNPFFGDDSATLFFHNGKASGAVDIYAMTLDRFILAIQSVQFEPNGSPRITWTSQSNATYQLEYKNSIDDPTWNPIGAQLPSSGDQTSATDPETPSTRFYRIRTL